MNYGLVGAVGGALIGLLGAIFGTWCSIHNTKGPQERAFMIRASVMFWAAGIAFVGLMFALPGPERAFLWIPYAVLLPVAIRGMNRAQQRIRETESRLAHKEHGPV